jgi:hypothetical protein
MGLGVVCSYLVGTVQGDIFAMDKDMPLLRSGFKFDLDGCLQLFSFFLLCIVFFLNMLATYISVAQPYHTLRLMTSGPTGFETAASYYLNKNIVAWRHIAIKGMLQSLPMFVLQCGVRLIVKFDRGNYTRDPPPEFVPLHARAEGIGFCVFFLLFSITLWYCHHIHFQVFREQYTIMVTQVTPVAFTQYMQSMMNPRAHDPKNHVYDHLDV